MSAPPPRPAGARRDGPGELEDVVRVASARHVAPPGRVARLDGGLSSHAFDVETERGQVVVRLGDQPDKLAGFERERRAVERARGAGVPTQEVIAVGREGNWAYTIARRLPGGPAADHRERLRILEDLGRIARAVHTIRTAGYGYDFGWDDSTGGTPPPGAATWTAFLYDGLDASGRLARLADLGMLSDRQQQALEATLTEVAAWNEPPVLNHGDLRLKNVVVDEEGHILGLIDWEWSVSSIGPHWDLSVALHDLSIDAKQALLKGYDMSGEEVRQSAPVWRLFNVLNYVPTIDQLIEAGDTPELDRIRTRLSGALDLYGADSP